METQNDTKPRSYGIVAIVLSIVVVALLATTTYLLVAVKTNNDTPPNTNSVASISNNTSVASNNSVSNTTNNTASNSTAVTTNTIASYLGSHKYVDAKYKFSLTLPTDWNNFFAVDSPDSVVASSTTTGLLGVVTFYKSTSSDASWPSVAVPTKSFKYGPAFYVYVYTKEAWDKSDQGIASPHGTLLGEKDGKVFAMNTPQDTPQDLIGEYKKVSFSTFKAL
jgi:cytoskeletal protein RodZ